MTLKTPWHQVDPTGTSDLARIVHDNEMGHVAFFESAELARETIELVNRAESREQELAEMTAECERLRERIALASELADNASGDYLRAILSGEIDRAEHARRGL